MKVLIIQENGRHDRNRNFRECFCLQRAFSALSIESDVWGLGHSEYRDEPQWDEYELIINLENYDVSNWVPNIKDVKAKKFLWSIDAHVKGLGCYEKTAVEGDYDLILQATPEFVTSRHARSVWLPNCYDDEVIFPTNSLPMYDWGFCGNINNRQPILNAMRHVSKNSAVEVMAIGPDMVSAICSYKIHVNANISIDINYRNFETMGCRVPLLTSYNKHYSVLGFQDGVNCLIYKDVERMMKKAKGLLDGPERIRKELAEAGYDLAKKHTFKERAKRILELAGW
jgi:hypothetical protein